MIIFCSSLSALTCFPVAVPHRSLLARCPPQALEKSWTQHEIGLRAAQHNNTDYNISTRLPIIKSPALQGQPQSSCTRANRKEISRSVHATRKGIFFTYLSSGPRRYPTQATFPCPLRQSSRHVFYTFP